MSLLLNKASDHEWVLQGPLNVHTISRVWRKGHHMLKEAHAQEIELNLQDLTEPDSASVALLLDWLRYAKIKGKSLRLRHVPKEMREIIQLSNLQTILIYE